MPAVGDTIAGKYRIERAIGAGGMGTVVAATHVQLGTPVALKFLSDKIKGSPSSVERFTREAKACAALRSEHICRVSDFGLHDGAPYIAMELLDGIDLARLLDTGATDAGIAVDFILQACSGLAEAHAQGIVHRDLKPGNLFLTRRPDGTPLIKVLDFGVAKIPREDNDPSLTRTSHVIGSPGYMAPEQLRSSKTVDVRADIWALGVILYELISTRHPFHAEAVTEVALKIAMDDPPPLIEAPAGLSAMVMRCLAKEPEHRFATVDELAAALAPFALRDRAAAIAAAKIWIESPWLRPPLPTTRPTAGHSQPATKVDSPRGLREPDTTHQVGHGVIESKPARGSRRIAVLATIGMLALGGLTVFALTRGGDDPAIDAATIAKLEDAPPADARIEGGYAPRSLLELEIAGGVSATISVDGEVWGVGSRISREVSHGPHMVTVQTAAGDATKQIEVSGAKKIVLEAPSSTVAKVEPRQPRSPAAKRGSGPTIELLPPRATTDPLAAGSATSPATDDRARADQMVANANAALARRSLTAEDLGAPGVALQNNITRGQRAKNWTLVLDAAGKLAALATEVKIDRALVSTKSARLTSRMMRLSRTDPQYPKVEQLQKDAKALFDSDPEAANRKLMTAFELLRGIARAPLRPASPDSVEPFSSKASKKANPYDSPRPTQNTR